MISSSNSPYSPLLLLVAGAKGAVASTLAVAIAALRRDPGPVLSSLTTADKFSYLGPVENIRLAGWDEGRKTLLQAVEKHGVLPDKVWRICEAELTRIPILNPPGSHLKLKDQVKKIEEDIGSFKRDFSGCRPVFVDLLPAAGCHGLGDCRTMSRLESELRPEALPDLAYTLAAVRSGLPVVNFTSNEVEIPVILQAAAEGGVPLGGRDGKTGQTFLKVVLASALKSRNLFVDGWYSLNLLGNADGENLSDPGRAEGKLKNKTELLDEILSYRVGGGHQPPSHKVVIDYYRPRGDAKEAWDVIDFQGLFGLPMSLRLNLQGRDSILAAPMVLDLGRWLAALHLAGRKGAVPELAFFFKRPLGDNPPLTFQDQLARLDELELVCDNKLKG